MQYRTLIVALAACAACSAQASIQVYGALEADFVHSTDITQNTVATGKSEAASNIVSQQFSLGGGDSFFGIRGSEKLGASTTVFFNLESDLSLNGEANPFAREALLGFSNDARGTFTLGLQQSHTAKLRDRYHALLGFGNSLAHHRTLLGHVSDLPFTGLQYVSPSFSGIRLHGGLTYEFQGLKQGDQQYKGHVSRYELGASYRNTNVDLTLNYEGIAVKQGQGDAVESQRLHAFHAGASYETPYATVFATYGYQSGTTLLTDANFATLPGANFNARLTAHAALLLGDNEQLSCAAGSNNCFLDNGHAAHGWSLGVKAPVGAKGQAVVAYQGSVVRNTAEAQNFPGFAIKGHVFSLGYEHAISARTSVRAAAAYGWSTITNGRDDATFTSLSEKGRVFNVGVKHRF